MTDVEPRRRLPPSILLVDGNGEVILRLIQGLVAHGLDDLRVAWTHAAALAALDDWIPRRAIVGRPRGGEGLALVQALRRRAPTVHVLVLDAQASEATVFQARRAGAIGVVAREAGVEAMVAAFERVPRGGPPRPMTLDEHVWNYLNRLLWQTHGDLDETCAILGRGRGWLAVTLARMAPEWHTRWSRAAAGELGRERERGSRRRPRRGWRARW